MSNVAWSALSHIMERGSLVIASIILSRNLDAEAFAVYSYFYITASMISAYAALGLGVTASRFFAESRHLPEQAWPPIGTLWCLSLLVGVALAVVITILPNTWISSSLSLPNWAISLGAFSLAVNIVPGGGILGLELYRTASIVSFLSACALLLGILTTADSRSALAAILVFSGSRIIHALGSTVVTVRTVGVNNLLRHLSFSRQNVVRISGFAGPLVAVALLAAGGPWLVGRIILGGPSGSVGLASYTIGMQWLALILFIPGMISRVLLPRFVAHHLRDTRDNDQSTRTIMIQGVGLTLVAALTMAIAGCLASPWLSTLYGVDVLVTPGLLSAFMLAAVPSAMANSLGNAIVVHDGQRQWLGITIVWFIVLIVASVSLTPQGSLAGAYAFGVSSTVLAGLSLLVAAKRKLI